ncbi:MAG TPA: inactive serine/threonine-protein kinase VRK3 [Ktedonobacteraceae bacterium]|nr:inactive serine/threonine-protein kinase VRK3 [Ktedonobacteraceae bacterium]
MSIIQTMADDILSDYDTCSGCGAALPHGAMFCAACGERLDREKDLTSLLQDEQDISARYRVVSLVRRRPPVNLYLALDIQSPARGRMVAMRDVDVSSLDESVRLRVIEQAQREYDLLRRWQLPYVLPAIDLRYAQGHLYTVAGFAPQNSQEKAVEPEKKGESAEEEAKENWPRLTTLQDFLQSGQGLPSERRALQILSYLCTAVDRLHSHQVIIGDLDPNTVILNGETVDAQPGLMISWLLPQVRALLSPKPATSLLSYFIAPEALQDEADARSDIYSLGAIFYLLLTGMPPEESTLRQHSRLRTPHEINPRMSLHISECVMQALAVEPAGRFQTVAAFSAALRNPRYRRPVAQREASGEPSPEVETVRISPLSYKDLARWRSGRAKKQASTPEGVASGESDQEQPRASEPVPVLDGEVDTVRLNPGSLPGFYTPPLTPSAVPVTPDVDSNGQYASSQVEEKTENEPTAGNGTWQAPASISRTWWQRLTGILPAIHPRNFVGTRFIASASPPGSVTPSTSVPSASPALKKSPDANSWLEQLKQAVLGEQQHVIAAAAIIETPMRVLPDQLYTIRLHVMGRDQIDPSNEKRQNQRAGGLSTLVHGDVALVEVRSVLQESYAYIVQKATVTIPAEGYVAEVTIPMQPLSSTPTGRRDRLHIFFLNEQRHPLYEKPFVLEIFVSHHVKRGSEGHHVLTIPV